jgi:hypothetical protein
MALGLSSVSMSGAFPLSNEKRGAGEPNIGGMPKARVLRLIME